MCPACRKPMLIVELDGIEIDHCQSCLGLWLDTGELEAILNAAGATPHALTAAIQASERLGRSRERRCPRCRRKLEALRLREDGVTIDACPRGDGYWLDQGELQLVARRGASDPGPIAAFLTTMFQNQISPDPGGNNR